MLQEEPKTLFIISLFLGWVLNCVNEIIVLNSCEQNTVAKCSTGDIEPRKDSVRNTFNKLINLYERKLH